jgi:hypothetical protein
MKDKTKVGGVFHFEHVRNGEVIDTWDEENIVVDEGLDHILDVGLSNGTQSSTWYVGIFKNNYTPVAADVASTFAGAGKANEVTATTDVDETVRETWTDAGVSSQSVTNSASPASYNAAASISVYGAFLIDNSTIGGLTGTLFAASKFTAVRNLVATDVLNVTYTLSAADA